MATKQEWLEVFEQWDSLALAVVALFALKPKLADRIRDDLVAGMRLWFRYNP